MQRTCQPSTLMGLMPNSPESHGRPKPKAKHGKQSWGNGRGGRPWRRKRDAVANRDMYTCQSCGLITGLGECDHIDPLAKEGADDMSNLQWLCVPCHKEKTIRESGGTVKREIGVDGWPV